GRLIVSRIVLLLLDAQDVDGALGTGQEVRSVLGIEEAAERFDAPDDHQEVVATESEHGIDEIVPRTLLAEMHFEPVGEEGKEALRQIMNRRIKPGCDPMGQQIFCESEPYFILQNNADDAECGTAKRVRVLGAG